MATKEQNIARLKELAILLGREPEISGTASELAYRVQEWEEEAAVMADASVVDDGVETGDKDGDQVSDMNISEDKQDNGLVRVRMLRTIHLNALADQSDTTLSVAVKGTIVRISAEKMKSLTAASLVARVQD
ncbi:DNA-packaging protein FI [Escherichia coli]|uniref:DNA-packaging protein FI n=1 Tax=Escherichia coli TaxID=562 RepID=UPI001F0D71F3|nr:DNA-packaging protein FI [Escherichia coli]UMR98619.1 DNA breaking-rejoining protein [Escherichia coli]